jgi:chemotaxis protein MotB
MAEKIKIEPSHPPIVPHWMVTFSDMRTVLLCFFVLLAGFSGGGKESLGPGALSGYAGVSSTSKMDSDALMERPATSGGDIQMSGFENPSEYDPLNYVYQGLDVRVRTSVISNALHYHLTGKGFEIEILCGRLFEENSSQIKPGAERILNVVAAACRNLPHSIRVRGYADDLFLPDAACPTEEALALARASVVCAFLHDRARLPMEQLSIASSLDAGQPASRVSSSSRPGGGERDQVTITVLPISKRREP